MSAGKLVRGALYVHRTAITELAPEARALVEKATAMSGTVGWNVARLQGDVVGLLEYEDFDIAAFPRLIRSIRLNLSTGEIKRSDFSRTDNPLILHRKEQLVSNRDPREARWAETTKRLVEMGLFKDSHLIGRQRPWTQRLAAAGLLVVGDEVRTL
jgi:DNA phosphorothioation-associated putative methyltransferase